MTSLGQVIGLSVDAGEVYVVVLDANGALQLEVLRVRGSVVEKMPIAPTDWSDYGMGGKVGLDPAKTIQVSGGKAYFLGGYGVTVVPLDGSPSRTLYPPDPRSPLLRSYDIMGSFAVDGDTVYACESDMTADATSFGRFDASGTWEVLFTGPSPSSEESCFAGSMAVDPGAVYWATSRSIRAYAKEGGAVTTVVSLGGLSLAPSLVAVGGSSLAWFDYLDLALHVVDKKGMTSSLPSALGPTTLARFSPSDQAPFAMLVNGGHVYWQTFYELHGLSTSGGTPDLLAHRPQSGGRFMGLATDGKNLYFTDTDGDGDGGGDVTLRSAPL